MPEFATPFAGLASDRKLTREELIRAIRYSIAAEYEAVQLYTQLAESIDHELAIDVLKDIADEERVHVGEFLRLLKDLAPDEEKFYAEGAEEVEEMMEKSGTGEKERPGEKEQVGEKELSGEMEGSAEGKEQEGLPDCTYAPEWAEHARGYRDEEPCDDGRSGDLDKG